MRLLASLASIAAVTAVLGVAPALASEERPTAAELERELVCPTCETTLDMSDAPVAQRMKAVIRERIEAGDTKSEIMASFVEQFGEGVLAAPPRRGFNLLAWLLPLAGLLAGGTAVGVLAWRWSRARTRPEEPSRQAVRASANGHASLDPELERLLEEELARFDR